MSKYPYEKHVVKKLLMYGNKEPVAAVIQMFKSHIRQMLRHATASTIVEYAYNDKAVLAQKLMITDELYGPTYAICKSLERNTIEKVVKENPEKLENIMDETKQVIVPLTQKEQVIKHSVVHKVFLDIFLLAPDKQRSLQTVVEPYNKVLGSERSTGEPTTFQVEWVWLKVIKQKWVEPRFTGPYQVTERTSHAVRLKGKGDTWFHWSQCAAPEPGRPLEEMGGNTVSSQGAE
ncbi:pumilio homolog 3-like [Girardinichthys multiradiatus]|uniref:pumilio homolog 3-like n=1 Tax=Girardinichthys multiradiatus TaxID=208333 RepID=UPI001FAB6EE1|nr:pumilio homolog 3-like [Girardinichthys multiradiatus]XP_047247743.1 pumilio homolog 3-like [Girardinichthys multiradiatus]